MANKDKSFFTNAETPMMKSLLKEARKMKKAAQAEEKKKQKSKDGK